MASIMKVTGVKQCLTNLDRNNAAIGRRVQAGLKRAGLWLQGESQEECPVDTGTLKNSAATRATGGGFGTEVEVGYTTSYALFVHENMTAFHPVGKAKFLSDPLKRGRARIVSIVERAVKGGGGAGGGVSGVKSSGGGGGGGTGRRWANQYGSGITGGT